MKDTQPTQEYSPETLAYAAGIVDGEGCISISKIPPKKANRRVTPGYELCVSVANTDKVMIAWLKETFGGGVTDRNYEKGNTDGWKNAAIWGLPSNNAKAFLELILPYLKIKHVQASLAIEFQDYKRANPLRFKDYQREKEVLEREEAYYQHLHSLHNARKVWIHSEALDERARAQCVLNAMPSPLTSTTIAYLGGILDGEGCIRISVSHPTEERGKGHLRQPSYRLTVKVANTDKSIIDWLQATFPGSVTECSTEESRAKTGCSQAWEWVLNSQRASTFLEMVAPCLKTKQVRANLALEFQAYVNQYARYIQGTRSQEVLDRQEAYRQQINGMNAKPRTKWDE